MGKPELPFWSILLFFLWPVLLNCTTFFFPTINFISALYLPAMELRVKRLIKKNKTNKQAQT